MPRRMTPRALGLWEIRAGSERRLGKFTSAEGKRDCGEKRAENGACNADFQDPLPMSVEEGSGIQGRDIRRKGGKKMLVQGGGRTQDVEQFGLCRQRGGAVEARGLEEHMGGQPRRT